MRLPMRTEYDSSTELAVELATITRRLDRLYARMQRGERGTWIRERIAASEALLFALQGRPGVAA